MVLDLLTSFNIFYPFLYYKIYYLLVYGFRHLHKILRRIIKVLTMIININMSSIVLRYFSLKLVYKVCDR